MVFNNTLEMVGKTPLLKADKFAKAFGIEANIYLKLEAYNPAGSVKDRIALSMINDLEKRQIINKNTTLVEATSGNTGIGLAFVAAVKGYKLILTMPDTMSVERRKLVTAYGAELVLTEGGLGMKGAIAKAQEICDENENAIIPSQFTNPANPEVHYNTTGQEIWNDLEGNVDVLVAGVGTGGTISGAGKFLKEQNKNLKTVVIEPTDSAVISGGPPGKHKLQGLGAGFIPEVLELKMIDYIEKVENEKAFQLSASLAKEEGFLVGISSGAVLAGLVSFVKNNPQYRHKNIVCVLADSGERYLSTALYD